MSDDGENRGSDPSMPGSDPTDVRATPETPWEFFPDDDLREEPGPAAEDAAMHVELVGGMPAMPPGPNDVVVHYLPDEDPEIPDESEPPVRDDVTPQVEDLLIVQHYMTE